MDESYSSLGKEILQIHPGRNFFFLVLAGGGLFSICGLTSFLINISQSDGIADVIVGSIFFVMGIFGMIWGYRKTILNRTSLTAFENGVEKIRNGKTTTILWDDVPFLFRTEISMEQNKSWGFGRQLRTLTTWRLLDVHQTEISLESFVQMGLIAEDKILPRIRQEIRQKLYKGETAVFGPISVDLYGIYHGDESFSWQEILSIEFDRHVRIHLPKDRKRNWREAFVIHIPNMPLLQQIIDANLHQTDSANEEQ